MRCCDTTRPTEVLKLHLRWRCARDSCSPNWQLDGLAPRIHTVVSARSMSLLNARAGLAGTQSFARSMHRHRSPRDSVLCLNHLIFYFKAAPRPTHAQMIGYSSRWGGYCPERQNHPRPQRRILGQTCGQKEGRALLLLFLVGSLPHPILASVR